MIGCCSYLKTKWHVSVATGYVQTSSVAFILLYCDIWTHSLHNVSHVPGTSPEAYDVSDYVDVGVTNMAVATGLVLKDGMTYYVTVRGEHFLSEFRVQSKIYWNSFLFVISLPLVTPFGLQFHSSSLNPHIWLRHSPSPSIALISSLSPSMCPKCPANGCCCYITET